MFKDWDCTLAQGMPLVGFANEDTFFERIPVKAHSIVREADKRRVPTASIWQSPGAIPLRPRRWRRSARATSERVWDPAINQDSKSANLANLCGSCEVLLTSLAGGLNGDQDGFSWRGGGAVRDARGDRLQEIQLNG
jgi:hypothetical protein